MWQPTLLFFGQSRKMTIRGKKIHYTRCEFRLYAGSHESGKTEVQLRLEVMGWSGSYPLQTWSFLHTSRALYLVTGWSWSSQYQLFRPKQVNKYKVSPMDISRSPNISFSWYVSSGSLGYGLAPEPQTSQFQQQIYKNMKFGVEISADLPKWTFLDMSRADH